MKTFIALILITSTALACPQNVQKIKTGTSAACDGWLVSEPQMQDFAKQTDQLELARKMSQVNEQLIKLSETEIAYYKKQSEARAKELNKAETRQFWASVGAFALGVVITGIAAKAAIESTR